MWFLFQRGEERPMTLEAADLGEAITIAAGRLSAGQAFDLMPSENGDVIVMELTGPPKTGQMVGTKFAGAFSIAPRIERPS